MAIKRTVTVERTLYLAVCPTDGKIGERLDDPPKEIQCPHCRAWIPFVAHSWSGPEVIGKP